MFGFTGPAYFCAWLYSGTFKRLEPKAVESENGVEDDRKIAENTEEV